jgi:predicted N-acetyltransferase YhbS
MIYYLVTAQHGYTMRSYLESWGRDLAGRIAVVSYEELAAGRALPDRGASYVFSDLDRVSPQLRAALGAMHERLVSSAGKARVLNDPLRSLLRLDALRALHAQGVNAFDAWRLDDPRLPERFPVYLRRQAGFANNQPPLLRNADEYRQALAQIDARGLAREELMAVEFCDTADATGVYRKYGAFVIGGRIVPRHVFFSRRWMVKSADLVDPAKLAEEIEYLDANPHAELLRRAAEIAGVSYGRIDYGLLDGRPQIWEINTNPLLANLARDENPARHPVHAKFAQMFGAALAAVDAGEEARAGPRFVVRRMRAADHDAAVAILAAWNMAPVAPSAAQPESECAALEPARSFVATADGEIAGVASYERVEGSLAHTQVLAVAPRWRGAGIGRMLQDARLAELKALGVETVRTASDRPEVIDWYQRHYGYRRAGTRPKRHAFGLAEVDRWTVLELDLREWAAARMAGAGATAKPARMATIVILEHELQRSVELPYMVYGLAKRWRSRGHHVIVHHGLDNPPAADIAFVNIDLTVIPEAYRALYARYPKVVNGAVVDSSRRRYSENLLERSSDWAGPVIVKTDANFGGRPEYMLREQAARLGVACEVAPGPVAETYPIYRTLAEVPQSVWQAKGLVVERFLPEQDAGGYYVRVWIFLGDRDRNARWRAGDPIVKAENVIERVPVEIPDEVRAWRDKLGFDFGKFDYVRHGERWVLLDANRTPAYAAPDRAPNDPVLDVLEGGIDGLLR